MGAFETLMAVDTMALFDRVARAQNYTRMLRTAHACSELTKRTGVFAATKRLKVSH